MLRYTSRIWISMKICFMQCFMWSLFEFSFFAWTHNLALYNIEYNYECLPLEYNECTKLCHPHTKYPDTQLEDLYGGGESEPQVGLLPGGRWWCGNLETVPVSAMACWIYLKYLHPAFCDNNQRLHVTASTCTLHCTAHRTAIMLEFLNLVLIMW